MMNENELRNEEMDGEPIFAEILIHSFDDECEVCGAHLEENEVYYEDNSGTSLCYRCFCERNRDHCIHDYAYKPDPIFYGEGSRFFGVELEIDEGGENNKNARKLLNCRGIMMPIHPYPDSGQLTHFSYSWPHQYWISCAAWVYNEFWNHYLVTGDKAFLKEHVMPGLSEILQIMMLLRQ